MMKKIFALLLTICLTFTMMPLSSFAATLDVQLTVVPKDETVVSNGTDSVVVEYVIKVVPKRSDVKIGSISFNLTAPEGVTLGTSEDTDYTVNYLTYDKKLAPKGIFASFQGYDATSKLYSAAGTTDERCLTSETQLMTIKATIDAEKIGNVSIGVENLAIGKVSGDENWVATANVTPVAITKEITGETTLAGTLTIPTKGGTDSSNLTGSNVSAAVTWSPALTDNKFAENTEYTATITVSPAADYVFGNNASITYDGLTFTKNGDGNFVATKKFEKTESKSITNLEVTKAPTKKTYTHGDEFDTTGMVVKATYDDDSVDPEFTGYTVAYAAEGQKYLKKGNTSVTLKAKAGNKSVEVTGLTVNAKTLTIEGLKAKDKVYDGSTNVTLEGGTLTGKVGSEDVSVTTPTTGTVESADVGTGKTVTITKPTLSGSDAGNYTLADLADVTVNITAAAIPDDVMNAVTGYTGTYNGQENNAVTLDTSKTTGYTIKYKTDGGDFSTTCPTIKNVGSLEVTVQVSKANYQTAEKTIKATVNPKELTADDLEAPTTAPTKVYDGTNDCSLTQVSAKSANVFSENITVTGTAKYLDKNAGTSKTVRFMPTSVSSSNYTLAKNITLDITDASITAAGAETYSTPDSSHTQTVIKGVGTFTNPVFTSTWNEIVEGSFTYTFSGLTNSNKTAVENALKVMENKATASISYTFAPTDTNFTGSKTGAISVTVKDIEFKVGDVAASEGNAVTEKTDAVYGDTWAQILTLNDSKISASVNGKPVTGTYSLNVTGTDKPNAGSQTYKVLFNGELDGQSYNNVEVLTGTVDIAPKALTASDLEHTGTITKEYDGDTDAPADLQVAVKSASKVKSEDVITLTGTWAYNDKNAGTGKTLTYTTSADLAGNYSLASGTTYTVDNASITPKDVTVTGITADARQYDRTTKVTLTGASASVTGAVGGDSVTVDVTNARGTVEDANASTTAKTVKVEGVELGGADAGNYSLTAQPTSVTVIISKADAPTLQDKTVTVKTGNTKTQTVDLSGIMPKDAGELAYSVGTKTDNDNILNEDGTATESKYTFNLANDAAADKTATVPVKINSTNYNEATVKVIVKTTSKEIPVVTVEDITKVYDGTSVATSLIKGTAKKSDDSTEIKGTFEFDGDKAPTDVADSGSYDVKFTPSDGYENTYASVTKAIQVTITPAATTGTPEFGKVTTAGTKLADVTVTTTDKMSQTGTFAWDDVATTEVEQGTSYDWTFTPSNANYATVTGSTVLWARASYGGGSGVAIETVQKPSINSGSNGSYTLSKDGTTATITAKDGYEVDKVTVNGKEVTLKDGKLTGLKTGDKVEVTYKQTTEATDKQISEVKEKVAALSLKARSSKTSKKNIKVVTSLNAEAQAAIKDIQDLGYTVKYKFYRSTKKAASYKATITGTSGKYTNTIGKKGTMYYYKARVQVCDANGNLVTQTALKQCKYANRQWTK